MDNAKLFCVTGPSGSGKTTLMRNVLSNELLSFTTRPMREGEVDGKDYIFISEEEFDRLLDSGQLAEWTEYGGNYYGLTNQEIETKLNNGHAFFICDNHGFNQIRDKYDNIVSIFLYADRMECITNMINRGDSTDKAFSRIESYEVELLSKAEYDYVIKNNQGTPHLTENILEYILRSEINHNPLAEGEFL